MDQTLAGEAGERARLETAVGAARMDLDRTMAAVRSLISGSLGWRGLTTRNPYPLVVVAFLAGLWLSSAMGAGRR